MAKKSTSQATYLRRKGAAAVEFALVLPFVLALLYGSIEIGRAVMVQHMLQEAAQAGCRLYSVGDVTQAEVNDMVEQCMQESGVDEYEIEFIPDSKSAIVESMQPVTVVVSASYADVGWLAPFHLESIMLAGRCTMPAEVASD